jgi:NAD(P)-dependent dehydrogenase (short-subunit alcohol dehydrogenase family)
MAKTFEGKKVLVTGGSRGLGAAIARAFGGDRGCDHDVGGFPDFRATHMFGWHQPSVMTKRCEFASLDGVL